MRGKLYMKSAPTVMPVPWVTRGQTVYSAQETGRRGCFLSAKPPANRRSLTGTPFVGRAGQLLDKYLFAVDIPREDVYIANVLKCRPPKNRDPLPEEEDACIGYLREQVRLIRPKVIVCLGRISAMRLIKPDFKITKEHGHWFRKNGVLMTAVYHPAALLRDPRKKEEMLIDMQHIKEVLDQEESTNDTDSNP